MSLQCPECKGLEADKCRTCFGLGFLPDYAAEGVDLIVKDLAIRTHYNRIKELVARAEKAESEVTRLRGVIESFDALLRVNVERAETAYAEVWRLLKLRADRSRIDCRGQRAALSWIREIDAAGKSEK